MVEVGNNIKIIFTRFNKHVIIDDIGGELLLYNHSYICDFEDTYSIDMLKKYIFTGVKLEKLHDTVVMRLQDLYGDPVEYIIYNGFIFVKRTSTTDTDEPVCVVSFVSKNTTLFNKQFYAIFIEKVN